MTRSEKIKNFDPNGIGIINNNLFGLPFSYEDAQVVILPVSWEVTVSYLSGTAYGPQAILDYSPQIDLYDFDIPDAWKIGLYMLPINKAILEQNNALRPKASTYIDFLENEGNLEDNPAMQTLLNDLNTACLNTKSWVKEKSLEYLNDGKLIGVLGGDHSSPLGLLEALSEKHNDFGILQIDAHADLRIAYEGFTYSHASIMYNALQLPQISRLVSVGVRDACEAEIQMATDSNGRILPFYDHTLQQGLLSGEKTWQQYCQIIVAQLPQKVYISFDIDGLSPQYCTHTGTPVPGGLSFNQAMLLLKELRIQQKTIIGFDLCEVSVGTYPPSTPIQEYNANVGSRVLYKLSNLMGRYLV